MAQNSRSGYTPGRRLVLLVAVACALIVPGALFGGTIPSGSEDAWRLFSRGWTREVVIPTLPSSGPLSESGIQTIRMPRNGNSYTPPGDAETASLAGTVWVDRNRDGIFGTGDAGARLAVLLLYKSTDPTNLGRPVAYAVTDAQGAYKFTGLAPDTYVLSLQYGAAPGGGVQVGSLKDEGGSPVASGTGTPVSIQGSVTNIELKAGYSGTDYDFSEFRTPVSKRDFITIPEPGSSAMLAGVAVAGAAYLCLRGWRKRLRGCGR